MPWLKYEFATTREAIERAEPQLFNAGAISISLRWKDTGSHLDLDADTAWNELTAVCLFPIDVNARELSKLLPALTGTRPSVGFVHDENWVERWQESLEPLRIGAITVLPTHVAPPADTRRTVRLDPGLAFGSGRHPSTALVIEWLCEQRLATRALVDVGSGSGLLALCAKRLGARSVLAIDTDPRAIEVSLANAALNNLHIDTGNALPVTGTFDFVVANIYMKVLMELAAPLQARLGPNGKIALSGLLSDQTAAVQDAYPTIAFDRVVKRNNWALLSGQKQA